MIEIVVRWEFDRDVDAYKSSFLEYYKLKLNVLQQGQRILFLGLLHYVCSNTFNVISEYTTIT